MRRLCTVRYYTLVAHGGGGFLIPRWTSMCHADFEISTFSIAVPGKCVFVTLFYTKKKLPKVNAF